MDKETWSIVLSLAGLLLGLLSAQAQLKSMAKWALKAGGDKARAWIERKDDEAELFASNSSALVAFLVKELFSILFFSMFLVGLLAVLRGETFAAPDYIRQSIMLISWIWIGNKLADVSIVVDLTLRKAHQKHTVAGSSCV